MNGLEGLRLFVFLCTALFIYALLLTIRDLSALAFDKARTLYALDTTNEQLFRLDKSSGAILKDYGLDNLISVSKDVTP
jgi:hypothetical protein